MHNVKRLNLPLWILAMCLFVASTLYANGDVDREFLKNSRAELKRLDELSQEKDNIGDPKVTLNSGLDLTFVIPTPGEHSVSTIPQKTEEEERAEEDEKNWLLVGMEKLSGIKILTENEKKSLLEPGSGLRLIDRYVLEQEIAGIKNEEQAGEGKTDYSELDYDINFWNPLSNLGDLSILNLYHSANRQNVLMFTSPLDEFNPLASLIEGGSINGKLDGTEYYRTEQLQQFRNSPINTKTELSSQAINPYLNDLEIPVTATYRLPGADKISNSANIDYNPGRLNISDGVLIKPVENYTVKERTYQPTEDNLNKYLPQLDSF
jgi:hypothetical protein